MMDPLLKMCPECQLHLGCFALAAPCEELDELSESLHRLVTQIVLKPTRILLRRFGAHTQNLGKKPV